MQVSVRGERFRDGNGAHVTMSHSISRVATPKLTRRRGATVGEEHRHAEAAEGTAVRVALWRAMHVQVDATPPVLEDEIGLRLADPAPGWRERPDMDPVFTSGLRVSTGEDFLVATA
jgi:hypothetical protein